VQRYNRRHQPNDPDNVACSISISQPATISFLSFIILSLWVLVTATITVVGLSQSYGFNQARINHGGFKLMSELALLLAGGLEANSRGGEDVLNDET